MTLDNFSVDLKLLQAGPKVFMVCCLVDSNENVILECFDTQLKAERYFNLLIKPINADLPSEDLTTGT